MKKFFTSDWHLNETRIGDFNPFFRPFKSIKEQNETIINRCNELVGENDTLYHLGDVAMDEEGIKMLSRINCKNKVLIKGNYDEDNIKLLKKYFDEIVDHKYVNLDGKFKLYLNHYPVNCTPDLIINGFPITGHIHGLWKVQKYMINVGVDAWHFYPVSEEQMPCQRDL